MKRTGGQIIMDHLEREGVPYALGIPGHGIFGFFDALRESDAAGKIKYIQVKHEQSALHMADGYFRVKGEPLAVFTSIGPGALNTAIGLGTAYVDSTAVLQFSGDTHVQMKGVGVLQEIERYQDSNFIRALEPLCKRVWRAESARQLPRMRHNSEYFCKKDLHEDDTAQYEETYLPEILFADKECDESNDEGKPAENK